MTQEADKTHTCLEKQQKKKKDFKFVYVIFLKK